MSNGNNTGFLGMLSGLLVGAVAGFGAGLLVAPRSGQETRSLIQERTDEVQSKAVRLIEDRLSQAEVRIGDMVRRMEELQARSRAVVQEGQQQLAQAVESSQKQIAQAVQESQKELKQAVEETRKAAAAAIE
jgi:gas vesicle protein